MPTAARYMLCTLLNGRWYVNEIGTAGASAVSYWSQEAVQGQADPELDRVVHTVPELDQLQTEALSRAVPFRLVFVADSLEDEVRRRSVSPSKGGHQKQVKNQDVKQGGKQWKKQ
jgi:hypothetical protein